MNELKRNMKHMRRKKQASKLGSIFPLFHNFFFRCFCLRVYVCVHETLFRSISLATAVVMVVVVVVLLLLLATYASSGAGGRVGRELEA